MEKSADKTIITVVGKDTVGIIARVCTYLAENQINVLDISQTIVQGYFNMMMIADMSGAAKPLSFKALEKRSCKASRLAWNSWAKKSASALNASGKRFSGKCIGSKSAGRLL